MKDAIADTAAVEVECNRMMRLAVKVANACRRIPMRRMREGNRAAAVAASSCIGQDARAEAVPIQASVWVA